MIKSLSSHQLRRPSKKIQCHEPILTDQSQTSMTEISNIIQVYLKTQQLPQAGSSQMRFVNDYEAPSFEDAHYVHQNAMQLLANLPQTIRNEIKNDYKKLEAWLQDSENYHLGVKYGLIIPKTKETLKTTETPPPGGNHDTTTKLPE